MKIGIIGCGVMGGAMARIISEHHEVALYSRNQEKLEVFCKEIGAKKCSSFEEFAKGRDAIIIAVKPKDLDALAEDLDPFIEKETLVLSILAGRSLSLLENRFSNKTIFRLMPNLPLLCGAGMIGVAEDPKISSAIKDKINSILKGLGTIVWLDESLMNAFAALTGSNPAFISLIIEAMVEAGISMGFKGKEAEEYVLKTIEGTIALLRHRREEAGPLRWEIASPLGTTIVGLVELEKRGVRYGVTRGIQKTYERGVEMETSSSD